MQNLIIFKHNSLHEILKEIEENLNFKIFKASNENILYEKLSNLNDYLIITQKKVENLDNQFIIDKFPIKFSKLIENINIQFLKIQYSDKSKIIIGKYLIDLNSRKIILDDTFLKLTEKETNIIIFLANSEYPVGINQLQSEVWGYQSKLDTHTVETHIYRLRKKILKTFNDDNFIISKKNGYQIN